MTEKIIAEKEGAVARIVFNQPEKRNAVSLEMWNATEAALDRFADDDDVRVLILSGAGGKAFVSGADISQFESERATAEAVAHYDATTARVHEKLATSAKPVIDRSTASASVVAWRSQSIAICGSAARVHSSRSRPPGLASATASPASTGWSSWSALPSPRRSSSPPGASMLRRPVSWD